MSKELFGETSKQRNNKHEEKKSYRNINGRESLISSFTLSNFPMANEDNIREEAG